MPSLRRYQARGCRHADPNPRVAGKGFEHFALPAWKLKPGCWNPKPPLNEAFAKHILTHRPLITLKSGMTLDGKIAPPPDPQNRLAQRNRANGGWITSTEARGHVHDCGMNRTQSWLVLEPSC